MSAWAWSCGYCTKSVAATSSYQAPKGTVFQCPNCGNLSILVQNGSTVPPQREFQPVAHVPTEVQVAWSEASVAFGATAYTAAEIMCRKILMHIAVDVAKSDEGRNFVSYIDDLDAGGYIFKGLKPKVDEIRTRGNVANHELPASTDEDAEKTMAVTRYLLVSTYELPNS